MLVITTTDLINTSFVQVGAGFSYKTTVKVHLSLLLVLNKKKMGRRKVLEIGAQ
jgi:hypothetical protein